MNKVFLHLSDLHFRRSYPAAAQGYAALFHNMTPPLEQLRECMRRIDGPALDFVLLTGDLTEDGARGDYAALREALDELFPGIPVCVTPGNHDTRSGFYGGWLGRPACSGPAHRVYRLGPVAVLSLDSSAPGGHPHGRIGQGHVQWLREALESVGDTPCILITHHHLRRDQSDLPPADYCEEFAAQVRASAICGIFCGHTHHSYTGWFGGKPYHTCGSLSFSATRQPQGVVFEERSAVNLCRWNEEGIAVHTVPVLPRGKVLCTLPVSR